MKIIITALVLVSSISFASNKQKIDLTIKSVEDAYQVECKFKKDTAGVCIDLIPAYYMPNAPRVCTYTKRYECKNEQDFYKLKFKMTQKSNFKETKTTVRKAILKAKKVDDVLVDTTVTNTVAGIESNFGTKCAKVKETFRKCIGGNPTGPGPQTYYRGVCFYAKKYKCENGVKVSIKMKEKNMPSNNGHAHTEKIRKVIIGLK